jgi:hypothetical protein
MGCWMTLVRAGSGGPAAVVIPESPYIRRRRRGDRPGVPCHTEKMSLPGATPCGCDLSR